MRRPMLGRVGGRIDKRCFLVFVALLTIFIAAGCCIPNQASSGGARIDIAAQFISEYLSLSGIGGVAGMLLGILVTIVYSNLQQWPFVIPLYVLIGSIVCSLLIGATAGFYPALRASNMSPTEALRTR